MDTKKINPFILGYQSDCSTLLLALRRWHHGAEGSFQCLGLGPFIEVEKGGERILGSRSSRDKIYKFTTAGSP